MQVKDYFLEIQNLLRMSAFIENVDVEYEVKSKTVGLIHGSIGTVDGSTLQFLELINIKGDEITRPKYRFHLMDSADKMVFRYDNAPHHPEVTTYPHHKHIRGEEKPKPSKEIGLRGVLLEIEEGIVR
ncbi:MAG: hypothetical protein ISS94_03100 [Candidatus Syntrophoarchaeum sp.]|nr:hypothetical protein [Candidatus Syntrophoarchaeum sp.]